MKAIIIPSKNIYEEPNSSTNNNTIDSVDIQEENFGDKVNSFSININLDYENIKEDFYKNVNYKNIEFTEEIKYYGGLPYNVFFVQFNTEINIDKNFLLEDLSSNYTQEINYKDNQGNRDGDYKYTKQIFNPDSDIDKDFEFNLVNSYEEFLSLDTKFYGKCSLQKTDTKKFILYCKLNYNASFESGGTFKKYKTYYNEFVFFSKEQYIKKYIIEKHQNYNTIISSLKIETNELMSEKTKYYEGYDNFYNKVKLIEIDNKNVYFQINEPNYNFEIRCGLRIKKDGEYKNLPDTFIEIGKTKSKILSFETPNDDYIFMGAKIDKPISNIIADNILYYYDKGKKSIKLKVGYADYYDEYGSPYGGVKGKKQILQVGEIVKPMKYKNGKDVPMSINQDGSPRLFEITSSEFTTKGAPFVNLQLIEKTT